MHLRRTLLGLQEDVGSRKLHVVGSLLELDIVISAGAGSRWAAPAATANRYPDRVRRVADDNSPGRRAERQGKMQAFLFTLALAQIRQRERETCRFVAPELDAEVVLVPSKCCREATWESCNRAEIALPMV